MSLQQFLSDDVNYRKIMDLNSLVWEKKIDGNKIKDWLRNFKKDKEKRLH